MNLARLAAATELLDDLRPNPDKACGGCTACCSSVPVKEIGLKAWTRCPHLHAPFSTRVGCSIYPNRPHSCQLWSCGWRVTDWPDDCRPDRAGVIVDPMEDLVWVNGKELAVARFWVRPGHEEHFDRDPAQMLILAIIDAGMGVIWDMPPDKNGQRLARLLWRNEAGNLEYGPPTATSETGMTVGERFHRARKIAKAGVK